MSGHLHCLCSAEWLQLGGNPRFNHLVAQPFIPSVPALQRCIARAGFSLDQTCILPH